MVRVPSQSASSEGLRQASAMAGTIHDPMAILYWLLRGVSWGVFAGYERKKERGTRPMSRFRFF